MFFTEKMPLMSGEGLSQKHPAPLGAGFALFYSF